MKKVALITGITGQDGAYLLGRISVKKKIMLFMVLRDGLLFNTDRIDHIYRSPELQSLKCMFTDNC